MKTLRDEKCRAALIARLNRLNPESKAVWGRMNVDQMMSHLVQSAELPFVATIPDRSSFFSRAMKPLMLYLLPMPKEIKTSAEMDQQQDGRKPEGLDADRARVIYEIDRLGSLALDHECLHHPFFGKLSAKEWAVLGHKHIDHHLRQFGV
jgi:hypothetical protein